MAIVVAYGGERVEAFSWYHIVKIKELTNTRTLPEKIKPTAGLSLSFARLI